MSRWISAAAAVLSAAALLVFARPATADGLPDAREVLAAVGRAYVGVNSAWFDGTKTMQVVTREGTRDISASFSVAMQAPGKYAWEVRQGSSLQQRLVCDGREATLYWPSIGQYVRRPAPVADSVNGAPDPRAPYFRSPFTGYSDLFSRLHGARVARGDSIQLGGSWAPCYVVQFDSAGDGPPPAALRGDSGGEMWIEKERHLVLREIAVSRGDPARTDGPSEMRRITSFDMVRVDQPLPDSLFTMALPESARKVEWFEQPRPKMPNLSGRPMMDFTLTDLAGKPHKLSDYKGKVVLLDFWATWCGPCRKEMPTVQKLYNQYKAKGLVVLGVNVREDLEKVREFLKDNKYTFTVLLDTEAAAAGKYEANSIPTLAIIDRKGTISSYMVGVHSEEDLRAALLLAGVGK